MNDERPLDEEELTELDSFLLSDACDDETLGIDEAHGFLTAVQLLPMAIPTEQWLEAIWGLPDFEDQAQGQRMSGLLRRMHGEIAHTLSRRKDFEPLVIEVDEDGESIEVWEGWCQGFVMAMEMFPEHWDELPRNEQALVLPMAQLAMLASDDEVDMDDAEYQDWVDLIPGAVMGLYAYWHAA